MKTQINTRIQSIPPSATLAITSKANAIRRTGMQVFSFAAGEPDFDTPQHIKQAAITALKKGKTHYAPVSGLPELRAAIAAKLKNENGLDYTPDQILVSCGAKHSLFNLILTICNEGDEVVLPSPYWLSYPEMIRMAGAIPKIVRCSSDNDLKMTSKQFEQAINNRTRAVILNSPSNPTGAIYTRAELAALVDIAIEKQVFIVSDEIYEYMLYDNAVHTSPGSISRKALEITATVNGFSKSYAMTGWRLGYFAAPLPIVKAATALQSHSTSAPVTFVQYAALAALENSKDCVNMMRTAFTDRRAYIIERMQAMPHIDVVEPQGAFYIFVNIGRTGMSSITFAETLLEKERVAVVPGAPFGADDFIRLSYACSMDNIVNGLTRIERFLKSI